MNTQLTQYIETNRRYLLVAAFGVILAISGALVVRGLLPFVTTYELNATLPTATDATTTQLATTYSAYHIATSTPTRLSIPKLSIDTTFEYVGLHPDKTIEVPKGFTTVGWYKYGATPGSVGPAIILGHVDSKVGAAVFYHLGQLEKGDRFTITLENGNIATFEVDLLERYSQDNFPSDKVYGAIPYAGIRLITCSGTYDHVTNRYNKNLVVYGHLVEPSIQK